MRRKILLGAAGLWLSANLQASVIGIIDSGVDIRHEALKEKVWTNPLERKNRKDDDGNGYKDDINGWNFFGNNGKVIDPKYADLLTDDVAMFFSLQAKALEGDISEDELVWLREATTDPEFVSQLSKYGNYAHGTHVAAIAAKDNPNAQILTARLIPVENPLEGIAGAVQRALDEGRDLNEIVKFIVKRGLKYLAETQATSFVSIGQYMAMQNVDVANASLGMSMTQARLLIRPILDLITGGDTKAETVDELAKYFVEESIIAQSQLVSVAPDTLYIFAAGNDGTSNDELPISPANIQADNALSVAATMGRNSLAVFSNFGEIVDIAAPGVAIMSAVPDNKYLQLSGTSQAAPAVAAAAAMVLDENPSLSPGEIKKILLGTVDRKEFLKGKVRSAGVLNTTRAIYASRAMLLGMTMPEAIASSTEIVPDEVEEFYDADVRSRSFWIQP